MTTKRTKTTKRKEPAFPEHPSNIILTCADHAPKADGRFLVHTPRWFVGKHVKRSFVVHGDDRVTVEHLWVFVTHTVGAELHGVLDNVPLFDVGMRIGDSVVVLRSQIEDVNG